MRVTNRKREEGKKWGRQKTEKSILVLNARNPPRNLWFFKKRERFFEITDKFLKFSTKDEPFKYDILTNMWNEKVKDFKGKRILLNLKGDKVPSL